MRTLDVPPEHIGKRRVLREVHSSYEFMWSKQMLHLHHLPTRNPCNFTLKSTQQVFVRQVNYGVYWGLSRYILKFGHLMVETTITVFRLSKFNFDLWRPRHIAPLHEGCKRRVDNHSVVIRQSWQDCRTSRTTQPSNYGKKHILKRLVKLTQSKQKNKKKHMYWWVLGSQNGSQNLFFDSLRVTKGVLHV